MEHLKAARAMGSLLIVALTVDEAVNKGPGRPINTWEDRRTVLEALSCVYKVIPSASAVEAILDVEPDIFVKGIDYADGKHWTEDVAAACAEVGAELRFTASRKISATEVIRKAMA